MNASRTLVNAVIPIVALVAAASCGHGKADRAEPDFTPLSVRTRMVEETTSTRPIEVYGLVQPSREAFVSSRVMGPVVRVLVAAGQTVSSNQKLLEIQPEASAGQQAQAEGALAQTEAALVLTERNLKRYEALKAEGAASDLELDIARMEYQRALGAVEQARGAVRAAATVASESVVRAPFAGRVVDTLVEVGDLAAPGRPLVRVESTGGRQIWLRVREADIARLAPGQRLAVTIDARPDLGTIDGRVDEIVPTADPVTHSFSVKVGLPGVNVPSGLSGRAAIAGDSTRRLVVPSSAVHRRGGLELVVVRASDGTARTRAVTTGRDLGDGVEVLSGLDAGEEVAVDVPGPVADGTPLEVRS
jgi:RND family efflux transporter MFP subunit